jgi:hypothetical protein
VSGIHWLCNGYHIQRLNLPIGQLPPGSGFYSAFSMYYCDGYGFWVLHGDATTNTVAPWRPLTFEHDNHNYSSYLTNAGTAGTLRCQRTDQQWPRMLLPDIYQTQAMAPDLRYGSLKGDLAILLALIALSMSRDDLQHYLPSMFTNQSWQVHGLPHGRRSASDMSGGCADKDRATSTRRGCLRLHMFSHIGTEFNAQRTAPLRKWPIYAILQLMRLGCSTTLVLWPPPSLGTARLTYRLRTHSAPVTTASVRGCIDSHRCSPDPVQPRCFRSLSP